MSRTPTEHTGDFMAGQTITAETWEHRNEREAQEARKAIAEAVHELNDLDITRLNGFLKVIESHQNNVTTPIESFILDVTEQWGWAMEAGHGLTPDQIIDELINGADGCRRNFDDCIEITRQFTSRYARVLQEHESPALSC